MKEFVMQKIVKIPERDKTTIPAEIKRN